MIVLSRDSVELPSSEEAALAEKFDDKLLFGVNANATDETGSEDDETDNDETDTEGDTPPGEGPFPVEPDGGPGDGAGPPPTDGPIPVEPDGGPGDGAGPPPGDGPFPVEPNGGPGDGAGPIPFGEGPFPVEPDGGIGDGAGPPPVFVIDLNKGTPSQGLAMATEYDDTFYFTEGDNGGAVIGFDLENDTLNLALTATDFESIADIKAATNELTNTVTGEVFGITIDLGNGQVGFLSGLSIGDLDIANIVF